MLFVFPKVWLIHSHIILIKNVSLHFNMASALPEVIVANFVHPPDSHKIPHAMSNNCMYPSRHSVVHSQCFCSIQQHRFDQFYVEQTDFRRFADYAGLPHVSQNVECCSCVGDPCRFVKLCPSRCIHYTAYISALYKLFQCPYIQHYLSYSQVALSIRIFVVFLLISSPSLR